MSAWRAAAAQLYGAGWELRRRLYAAGALKPRSVSARVVSIGNLTVGGTGKTTLALHLGRQLASSGTDFAIVCRRYHPGPGGRGDEELMYAAAFGEARVYAGTSKRALAARAAAEGRRVVLVDDGFSHWALERDLDLVLLDAHDPWGGGHLLPHGRMREPRRAVQRADHVVLTRLAPDDDAGARIAAVRAWAPGARFAAGRHAVRGVRPLGAEAPNRVPERGEVRAEGMRAGRAWLVTATGDPRAVERTAREAGIELAGTSRYRDHHWFRHAEVRAEERRARAAGASVLLTPKDAVRWPAGAPANVLHVAWEWVAGGAELERAVLGEGGGGP